MSNTSSHDDQEADIQKLRTKGKMLFKSKKYTAAVGVYTKIIDTYGTVVSGDMMKTIVCNRAQCYLNLKEYELAVTDCKDVLRDASPSTTDPIILKALASGLHKLGQSNAALAELDKFHNLNRGAELGEQQLRQEIQKSQNNSEPQVGTSSGAAIPKSNQTTRRFSEIQTKPILYFVRWMGGTLARFQEQAPVEFA